MRKIGEERDIFNYDLLNYTRELQDETFKVTTASKQPAREGGTQTRLVKSCGANTKEVKNCSLRREKRSTTVRGGYGVPDGRSCYKWEENEFTKRPS